VFFYGVLASHLPGFSAFESETCFWFSGEGLCVRSLTDKKALVLLFSRAQTVNTNDLA